MTSRLRAGIQLAVVIAAAAVTAIGCGEDFDPYTRLTALRVFAIKSEVTTQPAAPNDALLSSPGPGDTVTLKPLIYVPDDDMITTYAWRWCPLSGGPATGYQCLVTEEMLEMLSGIDVPSFDLLNYPTATFTHVIPPQLIVQLCAGIPGMAAAVDCEGGFPIQIEMDVASVNDPGIRVVSTLRLRIDSTDPALPPMPPNFNPKLDATMTPIAALTGPGATRTPIPPDAMPPMATLPRDRETEIFVGLSEDQAESYTGLDDNEVVTTRRERLTLAWFVESGDVDFDRTGFIENVEPITDAVRNSWTPALVREYSRDTARIFVIIRDNRGGVDWVEGRVSLEGSP